MIDWLTHKLDVSINKGFIDKSPTEEGAWSSGFVPWTITPEQLCQAIQMGFAYGPVFRGERRNKESFLRCGVISLDFDGDVTAEHVSSHPIVQEALTLLYTTSSDTPERRRFRMVFAMEAPIERMVDWVAATRSLALQLNSDMAAVDGARIFFGNSKGTARVWNRGLSTTRIAELVEAGKNAFQPEGSKGQWTATGRSTIMLAQNQLVRVSGSSQLVPLSSLKQQTTIHCPKHDDRNASAFVVVSSSNGVNGVRCSACGLTYWPEEQTYNFDTFDEAVKVAKEFSVHAKPNWDLFFPHEASPYKHLFPTQDAVEGIKDATGYILNSRHLNDTLQIPNGITLVKSPKGTGKTEFVSQAVANPGASVLLVGHRRALIRQLCERLGLSCYLDEGVDGVPFNPNRYGVCLDSLSKARNIEYDYIVIDESEQLLAHFLSETMEDRRNDTIHRLRHHISRAKRVIALDADLGWTTFRFLNACPRLGVSKDTTIFLNEYSDAKKLVRLYESKHHLIAEIHAAVKQGKRCYITANSRTLIESLYEALRGYVPDGKMVSVTSLNSQRPEIQAFLSNIRETAREYQVILTSPSVSTGVDISFENGEEVFDHVFGIFEPLISTHFDIDQQLLRVRNPKSVSVYVTPSRFGFETNLDVVKADLMVERLMETLIQGYKTDGTPSFNETHPLLDLACSVVSVERASKNNLKRNFKAYKERQRHPIEIVPTDRLLAEAGKDWITDARQRVDERYLDTVSSARQLTYDEYEEVRDQNENNEGISSDLKASYERTRVELFYREPISRDLLVINDGGRFIPRVLLFADMTAPEIVRHNSQILKEKEFTDPIIKVTSSRHFRTLLLQRALLSAGLWGEGGFVWDRVIDTRDLGEFITFVQQHKPQFESQFEMEVRSDLTDKPVSQLNSLLSFAGLKLTNLKGRVADGDKRITRYGWDLEKVWVMEKISKRRSSYPDPWQSPPFVQS